MASFSSSNGEEDQVLVEEKSFVRTVILNRPKRLNAASYHMISRLWELFLVYEKDPYVKLVILKGKGRAFCAGGDVAAVVHDINNGNWKSSASVFRKEYRLFYLMATYYKPQVSILNGIVMGAGAGFSIHGSFRVATENSVLPLFVGLHFLFYLFGDLLFWLGWECSIVAINGGWCGTGYFSPCLI
ncbi:hypothetical protein EUGRSUZ_E01731 [Eucalyptus grandis]|uniref:Uncharacterized protein n=2 Tax=Eucalyptus grandis TaxID=71139 RepID=A0ACC3KVX8_EUCGR|nr:hypothetical protein EUGRSUZ_E01731 [Eucalyptus grandis]